LDVLFRIRIRIRIRTTVDTFIEGLSGPEFSHKVRYAFCDFALES
jgi:hypothetical protein